MKNILPILFLPFLLLLGFCTSAQQYNIVKVQAFYRKSTAGNIPVNENGKPTSNSVTRDYRIYIETKRTTLPQWQTAYIDGLPYTIEAIEIKQSALNLGQLKGQETSVSVKKSNGNRLWQLMLTPQQNNQSIAAPTTQAPSISLGGTYKGKSFTYKIRKVQELSKRFNS